MSLASHVTRRPARVWRRERLSIPNFPPKNRYPGRSRRRILPCCPVSWHFTQSSIPAQPPFSNFSFDHSSHNLQFNLHNRSIHVKTSSSTNILSMAVQSMTPSLAHASRRRERPQLWVCPANTAAESSKPSKPKSWPAGHLTPRTNFSKPPEIYLIYGSTNG